MLSQWLSAPGSFDRSACPDIGTTAAARIVPPGSVVVRGGSPNGISYEPAAQEPA